MRRAGEQMSLSVTQEGLEGGKRCQQRGQGSQQASEGVTHRCGAAGAAGSSVQIRSPREQLSELSDGQKARVNEFRQYFRGQLQWDTVPPGMSAWKTQTSIRSTD